MDINGPCVKKVLKIPTKKAWKIPSKKGLKAHFFQKAPSQSGIKIQGDVQTPLKKCPRQK